MDTVGCDETHLKVEGRNFETEESLRRGLKGESGGKSSSLEYKRRRHRDTDH